MPYSRYCVQVRHGVISHRRHGDWKNTQRRFCRWRDRGIWQKLRDLLIDQPDYEWLMIDATHIKVHPHAAGAQGGNPEISLTSFDLYFKIINKIELFQLIFDDLSPLFLLISNI